MKEDAFQAKLLATKNKYIKKLPDKIRLIQDNWEALSKKWQKDTLHEFHVNVHGLAGSCSTFGLTTLSEKAKTLEDIVEQWENGEQPCAEVKTTLSSEVEQLAAIASEIIERAN